jgi:ketosteroid isomerase-like protein
VASRRVQWAQRWSESWNSGDVEDWLDEVGPDFEFTPDPSFPDVRTYSGEEFRGWIREWARTWGRSRFEALGFDERGDVVLVASRWHLAAPESREGVPVQDYTTVLWWDDPGRDAPTRMAAFFDRGAAERAAAGDTG